MQGLIQAPYSISELQVWPPTVKSPPAVFHSSLPLLSSFTLLLSLLSLSFVFVCPALFHSHLATLALLQSTHPDRSACCFPSSPPHPLSVQLFLLFPAPVSQVSACLFPPQRTLYFLLISHLFLRLLSLRAFSLYRHPWPLLRLPFPPPCFPRSFVLPLDSLSFHTMNPEGFIFFFLNGFATLPNPSSPSASLSLSFPLPLHRLHTHILLFFHPIFYPHRPLTYLSLTLSDTQSLFFSLQGTLLFPSFHLSLTSFYISLMDTRNTYTVCRSNLHNTHTQRCTLTFITTQTRTSTFYHTFITALALCLSSNTFSSTTSRVNAHLKHWQKTHLQRITRLMKADWHLMHHSRVSVCLLLMAAHHFGPLPLEYMWG